MSANARLIAVIASLMSLIVIATAALVANGGPQASGAQPDVGVSTLRAAIRTQWLSPADARRSLEARSQALADWLHARGGTLRIVSSSAVLRTHAAHGERLAKAEARFERIIEIQVPHAVELARARLALLGPDGTIASMSAGDVTETRNGRRPRASSTRSDF